MYKYKCNNFLFNLITKILCEYYTPREVSIPYIWYKNKPKTKKKVGNDRMEHTSCLRKVGFWYIFCFISCSKRYTHYICLNKVIWKFCDHIRSHGLVIYCLKVNCKLKLIWSLWSLSISIYIYISIQFIISW